MPFYIIEYENNKDGERHIHLEEGNCYRLPDKNNRLALGHFEDFKGAIEKALQLFDNVNCCYNCCMECYNVIKEEVEVQT